MVLNVKLFPVDNRLGAQQTIALLDIGSTASYSFVSRQNQREYKPTYDRTILREVVRKRMTRMENADALDPKIKDQFDWDEDATMEPTTQEDGNAVEEDKGGGGERKSVKPPTRAAKSSKRNGGVHLNTQDEMTSKDIKEKMKARGEEAVNAEGRLHTLVKIKWQMQQGCESFNIRAALINLLTKMGKVDPALYVQTSVTDKIWKTSGKIPTGNEFTAAFDVKQSTKGKGPARISLFVTIFSKV
eukprot:5822308-Ditylum_brightwellii.AAC.1